MNQIEAKADLESLLMNQRGQTGNLAGLIFGVGFALIVLAVVILVVNNIEGQPGFSAIPFKAIIYLLLAIAILLAVVMVGFAGASRMR